MFYTLRKIDNSEEKHKNNFNEAKVNELTKKGYLNSNHSDLQVTVEGMDYLSKYKVDNAIIMAAGFGENFIPFTYHIPQGLIQVNGDKMIERLIKQLHKVNIEDITVVTGHLFEEYKYLEPKYNVRLIYNDNYKGTKNTSSLSVAKNHLQNTYILDSNIMLDEDVLQAYEKDSWLGYQKVNETSQTNYESIGIAFLRESLSLDLKEDFTKLSQKQIKSLKWTDMLDEQYDYLKYNKNTSLNEIRTLEHLKAIDPNFFENSGNKIFDIIVKVFKIDYKDIKDIRTMKKGMTNLSFLFTVNNERYVFRVPGRGTDLLIARSQEADVYNAISSLDIADEIVYIDPKKGYKITKYYDEIRTLNAYNKKEVDIAIDKIRKLHRANLKVDHKFDIVERINYYRSICLDLNVDFSSEYKQITNQIETIINFIKEKKQDLTLCHIDPVPSNFLVFKDLSVRLIDWEYSGMSDPIIDVAMFGIYQDYSKEEIDYLIEEYYQRKPSTYEYQVFYGYVALTSYLWYLWTIYKEALGDFYGDYAQSQLNYSKTYYKKYIKMAQGDLDEK